MQETEAHSGFDTCSCHNSEEEIELWLDSDDENNDEVTSPQSAEVEADQENKLIRMYVMFLFLWQSLFRVSDTAIQILLNFFASFLILLAQLLHLDKLKNLALKLPRTMYMTKKLLGTHKDAFIQYVSCPTCSAIYDLKKCIETLPDKSVVSRKCSFVEFPEHPVMHYRQPCGTVLMKQVRTSAGNHILYPRNIYCYTSLIQSLQLLLLSPGFMQSCEEWRSMGTVNGIYRDIYDGNIWKEFETWEGLPFLSLPCNFCFILNVDWFQPYHHTQYSLGIIYIAVLNLPRNTRYLKENVIILGIIPGPSEPKKHINTFLCPLVEELKQLWQGVILQDCHGAPVVCRGALVCVACDLPAGRKVSGFTGPMSTKGCSRCLLSFKTQSFGEKPDFSNFDRATWEPRSMEQHYAVSQIHSSCKTAKERSDLEREYGIRYSVLNELPYFNASRMTIIDPMYNLLLGSAKYVLSIWKEQKHISTEHFVQIQKLVDTFTVPNDIGRIPLKIASGFSDFSADQWRNWTVYYSLIALKPVLPFRLYNHWHLFVKACHLLCKRVITTEELEEADKLLMTYCVRYVELYGKQYCTPNLHLHGHLKACIEDYGPVYAFWLFSFERLNGILGSYHLNNHAISVQVMRHFNNDKKYGLQSWPTDFKDVFGRLLANANYCKGSLMFTTLESILSSTDLLQVVQQIPPVKESVFQLHIRESISKDLTIYYPGMAISVLSLYTYCKTIKVDSFVLGSVHSKFTTSSRLLVCVSSGQTRLVQVQYYAKCTVSIGDDGFKLLWLAAVCFYHSHPCRIWYGNPVQVWSTVTENDIHFIPISMIKNRIVCTVSSVNFGRHYGEQSVLIIVPIIS